MVKSGPSKKERKAPAAALKRIDKRSFTKAVDVTYAHEALQFGWFDLYLVEPYVAGVTPVLQPGGEWQVVSANAMRGRPEVPGDWVLVHSDQVDGNGWKAWGLKTADARLRELADKAAGL